MSAFSQPILKYTSVLYYVVLPPTWMYVHCMLKLANIYRAVTMSFVTLISMVYRFTLTSAVSGVDHWNYATRKGLN